ncbi:MAG: aminotransferase class I/II-fold pyridoxal phosphate-dependent enzyme [bacterium]|nr:aminotransferase class I/II-fold pyridoxal phosphate-dependent enzyme [bacterium]
MPKKKHDQKFETLLIHAGEPPDASTGAVAPILVRSKTYSQKTFGKESRWQYSRGTNPTRSQLEEKLAILEGDGEATVFGSGVAAEASFFLTLNPGDHILACEEVYGGTYRLLDKLISRFGITFDFVNFQNKKEILKYIKNNTKYLFVETPTNPSLHIIDLKLVNEISKESGIPYVADMTFSPPITTRAFEYGAETVIHSLSKYIAGHNDVLGGAVITKNKKLHENLIFMQRTLGAILSPDECYRTLQEVKTLALRWEKVSKSALLVAEYLYKHPKIESVFYPGLKSHSNHKVAKDQMKNGFGGVISFITKNSKKNSLRKFVKSLQEHNIIYGESLASPETLLAYPPLMSHMALPKNVRLSMGIKDGFFRLSLGFEDVGDVLNGLKTSLKKL